MSTENNCLLDSKFRVWLSHNKATVAACTVRPLKSIQSKQNVTGCSDAEFESARESVLTCSRWRQVDSESEEERDLESVVMTTRVREDNVGLQGTDSNTDNVWEFSRDSVDSAEHQETMERGHVKVESRSSVVLYTGFGDAPEATGHNWRNEK